MDIHQRSLKWAARLEEVLSDFDALQLFQSWMGVDDDSSEHPLRLHFAIVAYREMLARGDSRAMQLAREIYNKFLRPKSGLCAFIDPSIRERIGQRLRQQQSAGDYPHQSSSNLFDECLPQLDIFLRTQHALFVKSHEFLDKFNASLCIEGVPSCSTASSAAVLQPPPSYPANESAACCSSQKQQQHQPPPPSSFVFGATTTSNSRSRKGQQQQQIEQQTPFPSNSGPTLTADMLLRSQCEREAMVPAGATSQCLFRPVSKFPYLGGHAQPSKNDSAVSSAFSSEAAGGGRAPVGSGGGWSLRALREEQRRLNQAVTAPFAIPRVEKQQQLAASNNPNPNPQASSISSSSQFRHDIPEGRLQFAASLQHKLQAVQLRHRQEESVKEQIERINSARQKGTKTSARELIGGGGTAQNDSLLLLEAVVDSAVDADEELENYYRLKLADSNSSANNSAQHSPPLQQQHPSRRNRRNRSRGHGSCSPERVTGGRSGQQQQHMELVSARGGSSSNNNKAMMPMMMMSQSCCSTDAAVADATSSSSFVGYSPALGRAFLPFGVQQQQQHFHHPCDNFPHHHHQPKYSMAAEGSSGVSHTSRGCGNFIPGAGGGTTISSSSSQKRVGGGGDAASQKMPPLCCCDNDGDTSGIGSMTSATLSGASAPGTAEQRERQRAAVFRKARELSTGGGQSSGDRLPQVVQQLAHQQLFGGRDGTATLTIGYRESGGDGVPVVAQIPFRQLTFREFRRILSISSRDRRQFFFRIACEDGSAPYQLLLINDDQAILPVFEGNKITAECRLPLSDSD